MKNMIIYTKLFKKYFSVIFLISIFFTSLHHHNDLKTHTDCKICILQSNTKNIDTPPQHTYLSDIVVVYTDIYVDKTTTYLKAIINPLHTRAPPFFS